MEPSKEENEAGNTPEDDVKQQAGRSGKESVTSQVHPTIRLEDQMNNENLEMLQQIFEEADEDGGGGLDLDEFRQAMIKTMAGKGELPDDNQLAIIFMKVDANCDGTVDWEEFCSYMLMENQLKDVMTHEDREMEFPFPAREIPSAHRDTMSRITYFAKMAHGSDDPADNNGGRYVSASKDGILSFWSNDLHPLKTHTLLSGHEGKTQRNMWVTDCVVLPNAKKIAVSSADREIVFYDCSANSFEKQFVLSGLEHCVLSMDYWCNPHNLNQGILIFGDAGGCVSCMKFTLAGSILFDLSIGQTIPSITCRRVPFPEILLGRHVHVKAIQFNGLHGDWVRKVKYYPTLQCFISCATSTDNSMYLGDVDRKKTRTMFRTRKGINTFDYCKEWNVIVTGGLDHHVRLWNPYVTAKPTSVLKGHSACISHILVNSDKGEIISAAQDKVIKVWDMRDLCCVQTIPSRSLLPGPHPIASLYYSSKLHCILVGTNQFSVIEGKHEEQSEEREIVSHSKPLCGALYNDLFNQVVSACHDSVVCVWGIENGEKIIQFSNAHGHSEITAMTFDKSKRRLITGARDGTVKIWNFNNGCCLRELDPVDDEEITGILCFKQNIVVVGWSKKVILYKDCRDDEEDVPRIWPAFHKDDILSISLYGSGLVATSSYDGDIRVWNLETGHTSCILNANKFDLPEATKPVIPLELKRRISENNAVLSALLADLSQHDFSRKRVKSHRNSILRDPSVLALSKQSRSICHNRSTIHVKDSDYDSVVDKILFLPKREHHREIATLVTGESGGLVRAWSVFGGGLLGQFVAAEDVRESVTALATNAENTRLMTGDTTGYIKVWNILQYCIKPEKEDVSNRTSKKARFAPTGSSFFPPLTEKQSTQPTPRDVSQESWKKKAQPPINTEPPPMLVKFRAHVACIASLDFVDTRKLIVTASSDCSVRLWTQEGIYIGTFGQICLWDLNRVMKEKRKLPHDVHRSASPDTLESLGTCGSSKWRIARHMLRIASLGLRLSYKRHESSDAEKMPVNIEQSLENVLGKHYLPKQRHRMLPPMPKPRFNHNQVIVYSSLPYKEMDTLDEPRLPPALGYPYKMSSELLNDHVDKGHNRHLKLQVAPNKHVFSRNPANRGSARKQTKVKTPESSS